MQLFPLAICSRCGVLERSDEPLLQVICIFWIRSEVQNSFLCLMQWRKFRVERPFQRIFDNLLGLVLFSTRPNSCPHFSLTDPSLTSLLPSIGLQPSLFKQSHRYFILYFGLFPLQNPHRFCYQFQTRKLQVNSLLFFKSNNNSFKRMNSTHLKRGRNKEMCLATVALVVKLGQSSWKHTLHALKIVFETFCLFATAHECVCIYIGWNLLLCINFGVLLCCHPRDWPYQILWHVEYFCVMPPQNNKM